MISTYKNLFNHIQNIESDIVGTPQIQKIFSSAYYIAFQIRLPGQTKYIYVGRGKGAEDLFLKDENIPSEFRKRDRLLEYLRKYVAGKSYLGFELDKKDRCFSLKYQSYAKECKVLFFYKARALYFASKKWNVKNNTFEYFTSWKGKVDFSGEDFEIFDEVGRVQISNTEIESKIPEDFGFSFEEKQVHLKKTSSKKMKFLKRKIKNIKFDLEKIDNVEKCLEKVNELDFEILPKKFILHDIVFKFKEIDFYKRRDEFYKRTKSLKGAKSLLDKRLEDTNLLLENTSSGKIKLESDLNIVEPVWKSHGIISVIKEVVDEFKIVHDGDFHYGIGLSARGNDQLRSKFSSKEDWWFHAKGDTSAHIIMKKPTIINEQVFDFIGKVMADSLNTSEVDIIYTKVKYLKSLKGTPGSVTYKKEKVFRYRSI
ncbi:MAG: hypothetical protein N4A33_09670 [Bacteriovoracaceae bacterium]|jgi:hypothetical protein|nr:hypothetical protein [Bacteriovoracaceae bacterium]